jgi:general secretion pathway protein D
LRTDATRNLIVIAGNGKDLAAMREAISVFDVDWMRGMSVALHPLKTSDRASVAKELETIFSANEGPGAKLVRFVPNKRLNAVLVITSRPAYLQRAATWIAKLDKLAHNNDDQLFVYEIQNRPAKELAQVLKSVLSSQGGASERHRLPSRKASRPGSRLFWFRPITSRKMPGWPNEWASSKRRRRHLSQPPQKAPCR